jgi:CheY-like chemotaxis protein
MLIFGRGEGSIGMPLEVLAAAASEAPRWTVTTGSKAPAGTRGIAEISDHDDATANPFPRILVVEDEEAVREFAVELLKSLGYGVVSANDGITAMHLLEETPTIDLVFTDVVMPGLDGIVLADMAKRRRPGVKILYATGFRDVAGAKARAGILHGNILQKPYRATELQIEIQRLLP